LATSFRIYSRFTITFNNRKDLPHGKISRFNRSADHRVRVHIRVSGIRVRADPDRDRGIDRGTDRAHILADRFRSDQWMDEIENDRRRAHRRDTRDHRRAPSVCLGRSARLGPLCVGRDIGRRWGHGHRRHLKRAVYKRGSEVISAGGSDHGSARIIYKAATMNLSPHFTLDEMTFSLEAKNHGIENIPDDEHIKKLKTLCAGCLEHIRELVGPVHVDSGYRSPEVNVAVGGKVNPISQHTKAEAADIRVQGLSTEELFQIIKKNCAYDELIQEFNSWVHVSFKEIGRRQLSLRSKKNGKETIYVPA
jgi:zinc D-Ala-D-Ala carboxypeptidase